MKEKRIEKEIKKAQKKGIYNPKLKLGIVALILVIGTVIGVSYAYYTGTANNTLTISGTVSKKIKVTVTSSGYGSVTGSPKTIDYGTQAAFIMSPNEGYQYKAVTCKEANNSTTDVTSKVTSSYNKSNNTLTITPRTVNNITCTVEFERVRTLQEIANAIKSQVKSTSPSSDNFKVGCPTSSDTNCSGVYKMTDDSNKDSFYFRGEAKNNYVKFGKGTTKNSTSKTELTWRIVRVNGDGSIRLVLDSDIGTSKFNDYSTYARKYVGYTYDNSSPCTNTSPCQSVEISTSNEEQIGTTNHGGTNSDIKKKLEAWYYDNLRTYDSYITHGTYCNDTSYGSGSETSSYLYYGAYERGMHNSNKTVTPILTCPDPAAETGASSSDVSNGNHTYGGVYKLKIGLLSVDEIVLAGFKPNNSSGVTTSNYLYYTLSSFYWFWSLSPNLSRTSNAYGFYGGLNNRSFYNITVNSTNGVRPVINLKEDVTVTGSGTEDDPYVVK